MASVNALARELVFKVVYYGPGLGGKTTTLQHIHATVRPEHRGKMVSLATPVDRTLYFDFLPIRLPRVRGMGVRLQLFTVPGQVYYNATRKLVLTGADGLVFVSDSQAGRVDSNLESLENLRENLQEHGRALADIPHIVQHNKRDLNDVLSVEELDEMLNRHKVPSFGTVATRGDGVYQSLEAITKLVVAAFESSIPVGERQLSAQLEAIEGGLSEALRNADGAESYDAEAPSVIASLTVPPLGGSAPSTAPGPNRPDRGAEAPGEVAARALLKPGDVPSPFTFSELWPEAERDSVREVEAAIVARRYARAIELSDALVARVLASAAGLFGAAEAPRDAATVPLLLGLDGRQYLAFRSLVREARSGADLEGRHALEAIVFAAYARILRSAL
ncbi:MAG TPA: ADP-ribosylation factor-like protein [Polyangiaceae bacterium]|nr:ADP-ribosylation factor-like protein [Polyangiaceae bacterium]